MVRGCTLKLLFWYYKQIVALSYSHIGKCRSIYRMSKVIFNNLMAIFENKGISKKVLKKLLFFNCKFFLFTFLFVDIYKVNGSRRRRKFLSSIYYYNRRATIHIKYTRNMAAATDMRKNTRN
jgi:hypothetical protein